MSQIQWGDLPSRIVPLSDSDPVSAAAVGEVIANETSGDRASLFNDDHLGMLRFQARVLEEAADAGNPLLERVRFIAIAGRNIDEFLMVRSEEARRNDAKRLVIDTAVRRLLQSAHVCLRRRLYPALAAAGIRLRAFRDLTPDEKAAVTAHARTHAFPTLKSYELTAPDECPAVPSGGLNLLVTSRNPDGQAAFVVLHIPDTAPRLIAVGDTTAGTASFVWLRDVVCENIAALLGGRDVVSVHPFRLLRALDPSSAITEADPMTAALQVIDARRCRMTRAPGRAWAGA